MGDTGTGTERLVRLARAMMPLIIKLVCVVSGAITVVWGATCEDHPHWATIGIGTALLAAGGVTLAIPMMGGGKK